MPLTTIEHRPPRMTSSDSRPGETASVGCPGFGRRIASSRPSESEFFGFTISDAPFPALRLKNTFMAAPPVRRLCSASDPRSEAIFERYRDRGIGPAGVGDERIPARPAGIPVVGVAAEPPVQLGVAADLVAVEPDAQARRGGHRDAAVAEGEPAALDHVVGEMMIVG